RAGDEQFACEADFFDDRNYCQVTDLADFHDASLYRVAQWPDNSGRPRPVDVAIERDVPSLEVSKRYRESRGHLRNRRIHFKAPGRANEAGSAMKRRNASRTDSVTPGGRLPVISSLTSGSPVAVMPTRSASAM